MKELRRHFILRRGGIASRKDSRVPIVVDDRLNESDKFRMTAAKIFFAIIGSWARGGTTRGTISASIQLLRLTGPAALRALDTILDSGKQV